MMKRTMAHLAIGAVAGAAVVGVPAYALAARGSGADSGQMHTMMSDTDMRDDMKSAMGDMMSDPQLRAQMQSMMEAAMKNMTDMSGGNMGDMKDGSMPGMQGSSGK